MQEQLIQFSLRRLQPIYISFHLVQTILTSGHGTVSIRLQEDTR